VGIMGIYRDRLAIIADILEAARKNAKKTQIMYQANLSYNVLQKYLAEITSSSLINFVPEQQCYQLTERGVNFMQLYKQYSKNSQLVQKRLTHLNNSRKALDNFCPEQNKSIYTNLGR
jgi:predicted transcriptional regulator